MCWIEHGEVFVQKRMMRAGWVKHISFLYFSASLGALIPAAVCLPIHDLVNGAY